MQKCQLVFVMKNCQIVNYIFQISCLLLLCAYSYTFNLSFFFLSLRIRYFILKDATNRFALYQARVVVYNAIAVITFLHIWPAIVGYFFDLYRGVECGVIVVCVVFLHLYGVIAFNNYCQLLFIRTHFAKCASEALQKMDDKSYWGNANRPWNSIHPVYVDFGFSTFGASLLSKESG